MPVSDSTDLQVSLTLNATKVDVVDADDREDDETLSEDRCIRVFEVVVNGAKPADLFAELLHVNQPKAVTPVGNPPRQKRPTR